MKGNTERARLFRDYIAHYKVKSREGSISLCDSRDLGEVGHIASVCSSAAGLASCHCQVIQENYYKANERHRSELLRMLMKGFEILELICVNLFLYPWRKEIRTLKKFTGTFVYYVKPAIPEHALKRILQKMGYTEISETAYVIGRIINTEEAELTAFELFAARSRCKELIRLIEEDKEDHADLFFKESTCGRAGDVVTKCTIIERTSFEKNTQQVSSSAKIEGANDQDLKRQTIDLKKKELKMKITKDVSVPPSDFGNTNDNFAGLKSLDKSLDSEEFCNKYNDLTLGQHFLFLRHESQEINAKTEEKRRNQWVKPTTEESNSDSHVSEFLESSTLNATTSGVPLREASWLTSTELPKQHQNRGLSISLPRTAPVCESTAGFGRCGKQGTSERSVMKLKIKMNDESLTYPVEETLPPNCMAAFSSNEPTDAEPRWTFVQGTEQFDDDFCAPNVQFPTNTSIECETENVGYLREPPNSTYVPPGGSERCITRLTDLQPEEDRFSQSADVIQMEETLYADTREGFVIVNGRELFQS
ncbi:uncharacterized protein RCH25_049286 [Pelodytes ibericus]